MNWQYDFKTKIVGIFLALGFFIPYSNSIYQSFHQEVLYNPTRFIGSITIRGITLSVAEVFFLADILFCLIALYRYRSLDQVGRSLFYLVGVELILLSTQTRWIHL